MSLDELKAVNRYAESTKSLSFLPQVLKLFETMQFTRSGQITNYYLIFSL